MESTDDRMVRGAMAQVERTRRWVIVSLVAAGLIEGGGLIAFVLLADWSDRLHQLLLVCTILIYGTLALGMIALGAYVRECALRIVAAVEES